MKSVFILGLVGLATLVPLIQAHCPCEGQSTEEGKCGCCPWPCCCKCVETSTCEISQCPCLNLVFIVDGSGSVGKTDWNVTLDFIDLLIQELYDLTSPKVCGDMINVALVEFGDNATLIYDLSPSQSVDIQTIPKVGRFTNMVEGIELALNEVINKETDCMNFGILIGDGRSEFRDVEIPNFGAMLRLALKKRVFCIGVTDDPNWGQFHAVCNQPWMNRFPSELDDVVDKIWQEFQSWKPYDCTEVKSEECFCCCAPEFVIGGMFGGYGGPYRR